MDEEKSYIVPDAEIFHDNEKFWIEIELPGVRKENIELDMTEKAVCLTATKADIVPVEYSACWSLAHPVDLDKVEADFGEGLLTISAPLEESLGGKQIEIKERSRQYMSDIDVEE